MNLPTPTFPNMADTIPLQPSFSSIRGLIEKLELSFPDKHPRKKVTEYDLGYQAGAIEVIRRLKEETGHG